MADARTVRRVLGHQAAFADPVEKISDAVKRIMLTMSQVMGNGKSKYGMRADAFRESLINLCKVQNDRVYAVLRACFAQQRCVPGHGHVVIVGCGHYVGTPVREVGANPFLSPRSGTRSGKADLITDNTARCRCRSVVQVTPARLDSISTNWSFRSAAAYR